MIAFCFLFLWLSYAPDVIAEPEAESLPVVVNQADIDNYIKIWPVYMEAAQKGDMEAISAAYHRVGWDQAQGDYVFTKINAAFLICTNPALKDALTDAMPATIRPSASEIKLVEKNIQALQKAYGLP